MEVLVVLGGNQFYSEVFSFHSNVWLQFDLDIQHRAKVLEGRQTHVKELTKTRTTNRVIPAGDEDSTVNDGLEKIIQQCSLALPALLFRSIKPTECDQLSITTT